MIRPLILIAALAVPTAAEALSCLPPNPVRQIMAMAEQGAQPQALIGAIVPQGIAPVRLAQETVIQTYAFTGEVVNGKSHDKEWAQITITALCFSVWCADLPKSSKNLLLIVGGKAPNYWLRVGPCYGGIYDAPTAKQRPALQRCLADQPCRRADEDAFSIRR